MRASKGATPGWRCHAGFERRRTSCWVLQKRGIFKGIRVLSGNVRQCVDHGPEVFRIREFAHDASRFKADARGKIGDRFARLEFSRPRDAAAASDILGVGDGQVLGHLLPLAEEGGVGRSGAQCLQLSEEGGEGRGGAGKGRRRLPWRQTCGEGGCYPVRCRQRRPSSPFARGTRGASGGSCREWRRGVRTSRGGGP